MHKNVANRLARIIFLSQSIFSAGTIIVFSMLSITAVGISGQESLAGLPSSFVIFTPALSAVAISMFINRAGWKTGLTLGYLAGGAGAVLGVIAVLYQSFPLLLFASLLFGVARTGADLSRFAVGQMFEEHKRATMIGRVVFASAIGAVVGPLLVPSSSGFAEKLQLPADTGPWIVASVMYILAGIVTFLFLRPDPNKLAISSKNLNFKNDQSLRSKNLQSNNSVLEIFKIPVVQLAVSAMVISQLVMVVLMVMTPLHIHKLHYGNEVISYVIAAHALGMFGFAFMTGYLIDKFGTISMLFVGAFILAISTILAPLTNSGIVLAVALFLLGLGWNFGYVAGSSLLSSSLSHEARSRIQGINDSLISVIAGTASLASGPLFSVGGYLSLSIAGLLVTILLIILIYFFSLKKKNKLAFN